MQQPPRNHFLQIPHKQTNDPSDDYINNNDSNRDENSDLISIPTNDVVSYPQQSLGETGIGGIIGFIFNNALDALAQVSLAELDRINATNNTQLINQLHLRQPLGDVHINDNDFCFICLEYCCFTLVKFHCQNGQKRQYW